MRADVGRMLEYARIEGGPSIPTRPPRGMMSRIDVSDDGVADWLVDYERAGFNGWCGTGGCRKQLFVSRADGSQVLAMDAQASAPMIGVRGGARTVTLDLHGAHCDLTGPELCQRMFRWDEAAGRLEEIPNAAGISRLQSPLFQVLSGAGESAPQVVRDAAQDELARCRLAGGELIDDEPPVPSVPDLDGDGVRDWILDSAFAFCADEDDRPVDAQMVSRVFVSGPTTVQAYAARDLIYEIDVASRPARLIVIHPNADCGGDVACPETPLVFDPRTRALMPARP